MDCLSSIFQTALIGVGLFAVAFGVVVLAILIASEIRLWLEWYHPRRSR